MPTGLRTETVIVFAIVALVLFFRFRRMAKEQPLHPARLWVLPPVLLLVLAMVTIAAPPPPHGFAIMAAALALGGFVGWKRARLIAITRCDDGSFTQQSSPAAILLLLGVIGLKLLLREMSDAPTMPDAGRPMNETALIISSALLAFMIALVSLTRIEMALRCRRMARGEGEE